MAEKLSTSADEEAAMRMDENEEEVDPRVQIELESLNTAADDINSLELQFEEAGLHFQALRTDALNQLKIIGKRLGRCVDKARVYYEAKEEAKSAQTISQKAVRQFQRSNGEYEAAKETLALAESRMYGEDGHIMDSAKLEMLNHLTMKVFEFEKKKSISELEHQQIMTKLSEAENKVVILGNKERRNIDKARPYFDLKMALEERLMRQKGLCEELQLKVRSAKQKYHDTLRKLEKISEEIHEKRQAKRILNLPPREPGVGAEAVAETVSLNAKLDMGDTISCASSISSDVEYDHDNHEITGSELTLPSLDYVKNTPIAGYGSMASQPSSPARSSRSRDPDALSDSEAQLTKATFFSSQNKHSSTFEPSRHRSGSYIVAVPSRKMSKELTRPRSSSHLETRSQKSLKSDIQFPLMAGLQQAHAHLSRPSSSESCYSNPERSRHSSGS